MIGLILINLILSMLVGKIAQDNGRSGVGWCFFAFFASPIVAGVVLFIVGGVDDNVESLEKKIWELQDQISNNQRKNDSRSIYIEEKIESLEKAIHGTTSLAIDQCRKLQGVTEPLNIIEEKYKAWKKIMELKTGTIDLNCPIRLSYGQIRRDTMNSKNYTILDFLNVGEKVVDGVKIKLQYSKNNNTEHEDGIFFYQYKNAPRLQHFGTNDPIKIEEVLDEQHISVQIEKILFADGTVWTPTDYNLYTSEINDRVLKVLRKIEGEDVLRLAKLEEENWYCVCGMKNVPEGEKCQLCGRWKDYVLEKYLSIDEYLIVDIDKYIDAIERYENIDEIENTIKDLEEEGMLKEKISKKIHEALNKYQHIQRVYGASKNDLDIARENVLEILKNV